MRRRRFLSSLGAVSGFAATWVARGAPLFESEARAAAPEQPLLRAWVGALLWTGDGQVISNAVLVTQGDRIVSVSTAPPPPVAATVDVQGKLITPGWIATSTALGLMEIELEPSTIDAKPRPGEAADLIRASLTAADGYNPLSTLLAVARREGVTSAVATPEGGLISGVSAWVDLVDRFPGSALVRDELAVHANLFEASDSSRPTAIARLRDALESARLYARSPQAFDLGQTRDLELSVLDLERLGRVLGGTLPLVVRVARGSDVLRLLALAESYGLRLILAGGEEAWTVAKELARARIPVIVNPTDNLPVSFSRVNVRQDGATLLQAAGVPVIFSNFDAYAAHNLRQLAGNAIASGVERQAALRALTSEPAAAFGLAGDYGSLTPGKIANFCVWTGDPFELGTWAERVVIRGESASTRSRQTELFERYRDLSRLPRGRAGLPPRR